MKKIFLLFLGLGIFLLYACGKNDSDSSQKIQEAIDNLKGKIEQSVDKNKKSEAEQNSISAPSSAD